MRHTFNENRTRLVITADDSERETLRGLDDIQSHKAMIEFLEPLLCNCELEWGQAWVTGDLTDAPILWIKGEDCTVHKMPRDIAGTIFVGVRGEPPQPTYETVLERWAYMDYQVRSVLEDLRDKGEVIFTGGN